ncbi:MULTISPECIES: GntR family transcriptional regulator [unclassified Streptomyces]|uniref:GntR family transcriptional regulator n=1 Tax=unclassified Streptomyces TaxID=2593676 RepID=UPI0037FC8694
MSSDALSPMETTSLADQAYRRLRAAVREGALQPGEKITERDLAARLGVSPTPVREALRQLVHEKVVERVGTRALRIADHSASARSEIVEAEVRLSALMARLAARNATDAQLAELASVLEQADSLAGQIERDLAEHGTHTDTTDKLVAIHRLMRRFHHHVEAAVGNPVLAGLLQQARAFSDEERLDLTIKLAPERAEAFRRRFREHRSLLDALVDRDEERAELLAARHHREALNQLSSS